MAVGQLVDPQLPDRVAGTLARHGLAPSQLVVEITEKAILAAPTLPGPGAWADQTLRALHALGAKLSLDDFGTGYSSLTHVRRFPLSAIKIDQSFVAGVCTHAEDRAVVEVVVGLGRALNLLVVAEGVETEAQLEALADLGCNHVQGHLIAEPMSAEATIEWVTLRHGSEPAAAVDSEGSSPDPLR
jgi:EAL domain-containing protein (putative c-di-GMP-specific phosphodiesterase class I)